MNRAMEELKNKDGWKCLFWATLQQAIVATSTYFIVEAGRRAAIQDFDGAIRFATWFAASLIVVYVPGTVSLAYLQKWRLTSFERFLSAFVSVNQGKTTWAHARDKAVHEPWLTNEALGVYGAATDLIYNFYTILLSFVLNIAVIAVLLDLRISAWYAAASFVLYASNRFFSGKISEVSQAAQLARNGLSRELLAAWENIFTGNRYNLDRWQVGMRNSVGVSRNAAVRYDVIRSLISSATVCLAIVLIGIGNAIYLFQYRTDTAMVAALLITFPRQLQTIQHIFAFFNLYLSWAGVRNQLEKLSGVIAISAEPRNLIKFIRFENIRLSRDGRDFSLANFEGFEREVRAERSGRYTLRARNGMGKSTLLTLFKERIGDESFYLPAKLADLSFAARETVYESDGNRLLAVMKEISALPDVKILLLDEWDANLDAENVAVVDALIETLSRRIVIVESRHRGV